MNQTQHRIDNARSWLADPKNATHPNRADIETDLYRLEGRTHTTASHPVGSDTDMASQIVALYNHHTAARNHQTVQGHTGTSSAAADSETTLAAQILAAAGITPRGTTPDAGLGLTGTAAPTPDREPTDRSAAELEAAAIRNYLASPDSIALAAVSRRQLEQRLIELEGH